MPAAPEPACPVCLNNAGGKWKNRLKETDG